VSLLLHKRAITRAVLGELSPRDEAKLRAHLGGCARCSAHYDGLAHTARALGNGRAAAERESARLFAALDRLPAEAPAEAPRARGRRAWIGIALVPAAAAAILLLTRAAPRPASAPGADEITLRGGSTPATAAPATVVLYASRKAGAASHVPVRLVGEFPGSGEASVSVDDYLQLGLRDLRAPAHVRVVGLDERGRVHDYVGDTAVAPRGGPVTLGGSIDLGREHEPGRVRLVALFSPKAIDDEAVRAAIARREAPGTDRGSAAASLVTGLMVIER
jgi:hypothetical protein